MKNSLVIAARIVASALVVGSAGALAWWDFDTERTPILQGASSPAARHIQIEGARTDLACPGPPVLASLGDESNDSDNADNADDSNEPDGAPAGTFDPDYAPDTGDAAAWLHAVSLAASNPGTSDKDSNSTAPAPAELGPLAGKDESEPGETFELKGSGDVHNLMAQLNSPATLTATARAGAAQTPLVTGVRFGAATTGDLRGIAAAPCIPIAADQWLVGGETEAGSSAQLELMNPSQTPATVRYEVWGAAGSIKLVGSTTVLVPPGEHRSILLEGLAPGERRLAVRVQSSGARIGAAIQDVRTLGLTPGGVDYVTPAATPATTIAMPGIEIKDDDTGLLRIFVPGDEPGKVDVSLVGPTGDVAAADLRGVQVPGGAVSDISLAGLGAGTYTAIVESSVPLTGSALVASGAEGEERDFAWMPAVELDTVGVFALPAGIGAGSGGVGSGSADLGLEQSVVVAGVGVDAVARINLVTDGGDIVEADQLFVAAGESRSAKIPAVSGGDSVVGVLVESDEPVASGITMRAGALEPAGLAMLPATARSTLPSGIDVQFVP